MSAHTLCVSAQDRALAACAPFVHPRRVKTPLRAFIGALLLAAVLPAAGQRAFDPSQHFTAIHAMVPARDGVRLNTDIFSPKDAAGPMPFLITRTPYGLRNDTNGFALTLRGAYRELVDEGFIFVFQDIRGRHKSEGEFEMLRPPRDQRDAKAIDEGTDTYDTIEWLLKNVPGNNGRAGMLGISYPGWLVTMGIIEPHPALKAASPQAPVADMFLGDDFHHNGAFRLSYGFEYAALLETGRTNYSFKFDKADTYEWYLALGPLKNANAKYFKGSLPTWNNYVAHPNYDAFWQRQAAWQHLREPKVATLTVAGWWDQEDFYGPLKTYSSLEKRDSNNVNRIVIGPWKHGSWSGGGSSLGPLQFGSDTARYFRKDVQAPFFAALLKDKGPHGLPEALTFQTGANEWKRYDAWPPKKGFTERKLYFREGGRLSFDAPASGSDKEFDTYISDPARPVPYRTRPIEPTYGPGSRWSEWLLENQRHVHNRPDVMSYVSDPLAEDTVIAGEAVAHLFAATSGTDSDWIVKLIDVFPDDHPRPEMQGYQLMVANEVFRGRFRKSFEKPEPLRPNVPAEFTWSLLALNHSFQKGHRLMVQVQSTWFPLIDRNPQKYVKNIFEADEKDFTPATQRIYRSRKLPSHIAVSVEVK